MKRGRLHRVRTPVSMNGLILTLLLTKSLRSRLAHHDLFSQEDKEKSSIDSYPLMMLCSTASKSLSSGKSEGNQALKLVAGHMCECMIRQFPSSGRHS
jgi:hypothetical protein